MAVILSGSEYDPYTTTRVTSKGQVTIPKHVRERMGLRTGDRVDFVEDRGRVMVRKVVDGDPIAPWVGFWKDAKWKSTDEFIRALRGDDPRD